MSNGFSLHSIRDLFREELEELEETKLNKPNDKIILYHGTTTAHLKDILKDGIKPRIYTNKSNYKEEHRSANNLVYLTDKWHYMYAYNVTEYFSKNIHGVDYEWWKHKDILPMYIKVKVPKERLTLDEDIVYSDFFKNKVNKIKEQQKNNENAKIGFTITKIDKVIDENNHVLGFDWNDSLKHYRTVGYLGIIKPKYIEEIVILGDLPFLIKTCMSGSDYYLDYKDIMHGKESSRIKNNDTMKRLENKSPLNYTIIPKKHKNIEKMNLIFDEEANRFKLK